jgi:hypothetical protein
MAARKAQEDPRDVIALPSVILVAKGAKMEPGEIITVPQQL